MGRIGNKFQDDSTISISTLHINTVDTSVKRQTLDKKQDPVRNLSM